MLAIWIFAAFALAAYVGALIGVALLIGCDDRRELESA